MAEIDKTQPNDFERAGVNPFNAPIPGESLTTNPEERKPWEQPPKHTEIQPVMEELFISLSRRENFIELLNLLKNNTPIDELAQVILYRGMTEGLFNPDLMLLLIEPTMYLLIAIAEEYDIEPTIYEGFEDELIDERDIKDEISRKNIVKDKVKQINKDSVPSSILARVKDLPSEEELGMGE